MSVLEDQVRAIEEWLAEEFPQALAVETDMGSPALAKFTVAIDSQSRYLLAVAREFFKDHATPATMGIGDIKALPRTAANGPRGGTKPLLQIALCS